MERTEACTCPLCRKPIDLPADFVSQDNNEAGLTDIRVEGLAISLRVSTDIAKWVFDILNSSTRQLLTTEEPMPFTWNADAMLADLPKLIVTIARRFHLQSEHACPADLHFLKLHNPLSPSTGQPHGIAYLNFLSRSDAPLARHPDTHLMYRMLCICIEGRDSVMGVMSGKCSSWEGLAQTLFCRSVDRGMLASDGGVGKQRWRAFVWCVVKGLIVWQGYCEQIQELIDDLNANEAE